MRIIFIVILFLVRGIVSAQFGPSYSTVRTPYGNVTTMTYNYTPRTYGNTGASQKYNFTVVLNSDSTISAKTKIDVKEKQNKLIIKTPSGKQDILPKDTKELFRINTAGKKVTGIPADSCWLFKIIYGKINSYSNLSDALAFGSIAVQKGDDAPIVPLTKKNVEDMLSDSNSEKVKKQVKKGNMIAAIIEYNKEFEQAEKKRP